MNKITQTVIIAAVTVTVVLTIQTVWHHHRTPDLTTASHSGQIKLASAESAEAVQAARDFLGALGSKDWDTVAKFWPENAPKGRRFEDMFTDQMKSMVSGLEITRVGTPFKEGPNSWVLVPYAVTFQGGNIQSNSLRLGKDRGGNWHWQGGF